MFLGCSCFFTKSEADVLVNGVLGQNTAFITNRETDRQTETYRQMERERVRHTEEQANSMNKLILQ